MKRTHQCITPNNSTFNILANDPSFTAWGWVVLNHKGQILKQGCIKTKTEGKKRRIRKGDETVQRTGEINKVLLDVIKEYKISYIVTELVHGSQNAAGAIMIGITIGILRTISDTLNIGIEWYGENDAKKCALGRISSTKQEMIDAMDKIYNVNWFGVKYKDEAIADALAIHNVAMHESSTLKLMMR